MAKGREMQGDAKWGHRKSGGMAGICSEEGWWEQRLGQGYQGPSAPWS